ncbi:MAG: GxxExxY protein [Planctomycetota bacterium]|nr:GxxExxY protein [Planctomycetota bacterium]
MESADEILGFEEPSEDVDRLAYAVLGASIEIHSELGPGHAESAYEKALCIELTKRGIPFVHQSRFTLMYKDHEVGEGRIDLLVGGLLVVEIKAVDALAPLHTAQVVSYLNATDKSLGLLINFNVRRLKDGVKRVARTH